MNVTATVGAPARQLLLDLRRVAVAADAVGRDVLVDRDEVRRLGRARARRRRRPSWRRSRRRLRYGAQRREREERRGREAARVGDEVGAARCCSR